MFVTHHMVFIKDAACIFPYYTPIDRYMNESDKNLNVAILL